MSPILTAYKNGQCLIQGPFFRFHDCYHLCKIEARQAAWELWSNWETSDIWQRCQRVVKFEPWSR